MDGTSMRPSSDGCWRTMWKFGSTSRMVLIVVFHSSGLVSRPTSHFDHRTGCRLPSGMMLLSGSLFAVPKSNAG